MELDATAPETGLATPAIETPEVETEQDAGPVSLDDPIGEADESEVSAQEADETPEEAAEFAEIEINGKKYQVPAELKDGYMMHSAFTQKTQVVAEEKRAVEAMQLQAQQMLQASQEEMNVRAAYLNVNEQLQQYEGVDWQALLREDPIGFQEHRLNYETLQKTNGQVVQYLQQAEQNRSANAQQDIAKRLQETREFAEKEIKGWTPEVDTKLTEFATKELGFPVEQLLDAYNPNVYKGLYLAWVGAQTLQKQSAVKPAGQAAPLKPLSTVTARSNAPVTKDPSDMSMKEYKEWADRKYKKG
jgi:hypothetical protein